MKDEEINRAMRAKFESQSQLGRAENEGGRVMTLTGKTLSTFDLPRAIAAVGISIVCYTMLASSTAAAQENKSTGSNSGGSSGTNSCGGKTSLFSKSEIQSMAQEVHGSKADCYMKLYDAETSSNPACDQQSVPNPPGIGLCTLEGDPTKRKARGGPCAVENSELTEDSKEDIENQMKCCAYIMQNGGDQYFQPVKEGKVQNCEASASLGG